MDCLIYECSHKKGENKMNEYKVLSEIIELCLYLDIMECKTYYKFHKKSRNPEIKEKWLQRCEEERTHIRFWREAFELSKKEELLWFLKIR